MRYEPQQIILMAGLSNWYTILMTATWRSRTSALRTTVSTFYAVIPPLLHSTAFSFSSSIAFCGSLFSINVVSFYEGYTEKPN